jgi:hypothetical protein
MLSTLLSLPRIESESAGTAAQALSKAKAASLDLYLLEAWLPDLMGLSYAANCGLRTLTLLLFSFPLLPMTQIKGEQFRQAQTSTLPSPI